MSNQKKWVNEIEQTKLITQKTITEPLLAFPIVFIVTLIQLWGENYTFDNAIFTSFALGVIVSIGTYVFNYKRLKKLGLLK